MLAVLEAQLQTSAVLGRVERLITDTGYCSDANILACEAAQIEPFIAVARQDHHPDWRERHTQPPALPEQATPTQALAHRLKTKLGRAIYALRKQTVLRARGGYKINCTWSGGQVTSYNIIADRVAVTGPVPVRVNGQVVQVTPQAG